MRERIGCGHTVWLATATLHPVCGWDGSRGDLTLAKPHLNTDDCVTKGKPCFLAAGQEQCATHVTSEIQLSFSSVRLGYHLWRLTSLTFSVLFSSESCLLWGLVQSDWTMKSAWRGPTEIWGLEVFSFIAMICLHTKWVCGHRPCKITQESMLGSDWALVCAFVSGMETEKQQGAEWILTFHHESSTVFPLPLY